VKRQLPMIFALVLALVAPAHATAETKDWRRSSWFSALGDEEAAPIYEKASHAMATGDFPAAIVLFSRLAATSSYKGLEVLLNLADCHCKSADPKRSLQWLKVFDDRFEACARSHFLRGQCLFLHGQFDQAVLAYKQSLQFNPDDPETHLQLAIAYDMTDAPNMTVTHAQKAVQLDSSYKKRLAPLIQNSNVSRRIGKIITEVLRDTEQTTLTNEQMDDYARRVGKILGEEDGR